MTHWVKETVDYFLNKGSADMYNIDVKIFGTIDMRRAKNEPAHEIMVLIT